MMFGTYSNYESRLSRLVILQKLAIRVVARVSSREHTGPIFSRLKILNIEQIKIFHVGEFMYGYHHGLLPLAFRGFFKLGTEIPKNIPTLPEMPEPIDLLSPALTLAYCWFFNVE